MNFGFFSWIKFQIDLNFYSDFTFFSLKLGLYAYSMIVLENCDIHCYTEGSESEFISTYEEGRENGNSRFWVNINAKSLKTKFSSDKNYPQKYVL